MCELRSLGLLQIPRTDSGPPVVRHGEVDPKLLFEAQLTDTASQGPRQLLVPEQTKRLVEVISDSRTR